MASEGTDAAVRPALRASERLWTIRDSSFWIVEFRLGMLQVFLHNSEPADGYERHARPNVLPSPTKPDSNACHNLPREHQQPFASSPVMESLLFKYLTLPFVLQALVPSPNLPPQPLQ